MNTAGRFWSKVDKSGECWLWTATRNRGGGYGAFNADGWQMVQAHRYAYENTIGPIPEGMTLDHLCRTRHCVRPSHLEPVSNKTNVLRGNGITARLAKVTHCPRNHPYDLFNTLVKADGNRECRECKRERNRVARRKAGR